MFQNSYHFTTSIGQTDEKLVQNSMLRKCVRQRKIRESPIRFESPQMLALKRIQQQSIVDNYNILEIQTNKVYTVKNSIQKYFQLPYLNRTVNYRIYNIL